MVPSGEKITAFERGIFEKSFSERCLQIGTAASNIFFTIVIIALKGEIVILICFPVDSHRSPAHLPGIVAMVGAVAVKIFSARACEPEMIPVVQAWAEKHGLGRLEVTNQKDYNLIRFYADRGIQIVHNGGKTVRM